MLDVHDRLDAQPRAGRPARPRARGAARRARRSPSGAPPALGPRRSRSSRSCSPTARSRSTRRCSTPTCPRTRTCHADLGALLPRAAARALRRRGWSATGCAARSSPRASRTAWSTAPASTFAFRLERGDRRARRGHRARLRGRARGLRHARASGRRSRRSTTESPRRPRSTCCSRRAGSSSARRAGCCATATARSTSPRRSSTSPAAREPSRRALPDILVDADREAWDARVASWLQAGRARTRSPRRVASLGALFAALDIVEVAEATERPVDDVAALHFGLGARCTCTGCATGSPSCRATTAGRRWRARRCATTSSRCTASSPRTSCGRRPSEGDADARLDAWMDGNAPGARALPRYPRRHPRPAAPTTSRRCRSRCASCAT